MGPICKEITLISTENIILARRQILMEDMNVLIHLQSQELIVNPERSFMAQLKVK